MLRTLRWAAPAVVATAVLALAGCGGSDTPALAGPTPTPAPVVVPVDGAGIGVVTIGAVEAPVVHSGPAAAAITAQAGALARGLAAAGRDCPMIVERADASVVSLRWACTDGTVSTGTWAAPTGQRDTLADVLQGDWPAYLSSVARTQLEAGGASDAEATAAAPPSPAVFARWYLTPGTLDVTFLLPGGPVTVGYPTSTLGAYAAPGGPAATA